MASAPSLSFHLEDQFGKRRDSSELAGRVAVVLGGDRAARGLLEAWGEALQQALAGRGLTDRVAGYAVADLRGVPPMVRGLVRALLPRERNLAVLLDWEGDIARRHDFVSGRCNVIVTDRGGAVALQSDEGAVSEARLATVVAAIARLAAAGAAR